jgi:hypothetical protein
MVCAGILLLEGVALEHTGAVDNAMASTAGIFHGCPTTRDTNKETSAP